MRGTSWLRGSCAIAAFPHLPPVPLVLLVIPVIPFAFPV